MKRILLIICIALSQFAVAAEPHLRIGTLNVVPYGYQSVQGRPDGAFYQLGNRIAAQANLNASNVLLPTARLYVMLERRQLDLAITSRSLDTRAGMVNLGRVWQFEGVVLYRHDRRVIPKALGDFKPYLIGRLNNTCPMLSQQGMKVYELAELSQGLRMLEAKRLDALCGESGSLNAAIRAIKLDTRLLAEPFVFLRADVSVFANPQLPPDVLDRLRTAIKQLNESGFTEQLFGRYIDAAPTDPKPTQRSRS